METFAVTYSTGFLAFMLAFFGTIAILLPIIWIAEEINFRLKAKK